MTRCDQCHTFVDLSAKTDPGVGWLCLNCITSNLAYHETHRKEQP